MTPAERRSYSDGLPTGSIPFDETTATIMLAQYTDHNRPVRCFGVRIERLAMVFGDGQG